MRASILHALIIAVVIMAASPVLAQHGGGCACGRNGTLPSNWELEYPTSSVWYPAAVAEFNKWGNYATVVGSLTAGDLVVNKANSKNEICFLTPANAQTAYGFVLDSGTFGVTWMSPQSAFGSPTFNACPPPAGTTCGTFTETDVILNSDFSRGWTATGPPDFNDNSGPAYFGATVLHEVGHAFGLHHNFYNLSTMNYFEDYAAWYCALADAAILRAHYSTRVRTVADMAAYPFRHTGDYKYGGATIASISPTSAAQGATVSLRDFSLENTGTSASSNVRLNVYLSTNATISTSDVLLGSLVWSTFNSNSFWDGTSWDFAVPSDAAPGTYYVGAIATIGGNEDGTAYNNTWVLDSNRRLTITAACTDAYEPNNSSTTGTVITAGSAYAGKICDATDVDWFKLSLTAGQAITINLSVPPGSDFDLELYDTAGLFRKGSYTRTSGAAEAITDTVPVTGTSYVRAYGFQGASNTQSTYSLSYSLSPVLTASKSGAGSGTVTSNPAGINCGSTCSSPFATNTNVVLTASAASGSVFANWSGACSGTGTQCTLTFTSNTSVTANFNVAPQMLTVTRNGTGAGTVTSAPAGISCGSTCASNFAYNSSVTLSASPSSGSVFAGWATDCSGTGQCAVTMSQARAVSATFTLLPPATPTGLVATATSSTSVALTWSAVETASSYEIYRRSAGTGFSQRGTSPTASYNDAASPNTAYLYRLRALNGGGSSGDSTQDLATTVVLTNEPLTSGTAIRAVHITELQTAINAVRNLAGLQAGSFTSVNAGEVIRGTHVTELRSSLDAALSALSLNAGGYTDGSLPGMPCRALHLQEIRNRIK